MHFLYTQVRYRACSTCIQRRNVFVAAVTASIMTAILGNNISLSQCHVGLRTMTAENWLPGVWYRLHPAC